MARLPRIDVVGVPQHVVVRGVDRRPCFFVRADRALYLDLLRDAAVRSGVVVHAFVLMTNHVHLLATGNAPGALSAMMQVIGVRYVRRINSFYARTGTLFEGRFRSSLVQSDRYLLACMRYIELNPVRARIVERAGDFPWSSYRGNAGMKRVEWLVPHAEYQRLGASVAERAKAWRDLVAMALDECELASIRRHVNANRVLGDDRFQGEVAAMLGRRVRIMPPGRPGDSRGGASRSFGASGSGQPEAAPSLPSRAGAGLLQMDKSNLTPFGIAKSIQRASCVAVTPKSVNIHAAKTQLSKLVDQAAAGDEIVIAKAGKPVARLVPLAPAGRIRKLGALKGKLRVPTDFDAPLPAKVIAAFEGR